MKTLKLLLIVLVFTSCHTNRKISELHQETTKAVEVTRSEKSQDNAKINNNLVTKQKITKTVTEFFPSDEESDSQEQNNADLHNAKPDKQNHTIKPGKSEKPKKGAVKSITTTTIETTTEDKGTAETSHAAKNNEDFKSSESSSGTTTDTKEPAPDPKRFMWIFFILAIVACGIIYLMKSPAGTWIKSVLSRITGKNKI